MSSAGTGTTSVALLFSFSAVLFLFLLHLQAPAPGLAVADLLASALDRFLDGRGVLELATRRNMILLCHAILFLILRDAGLLGKPARRRSTPGEAATATNAVVVAQSPTAVPVPARPHATRSAVVVWRRRRTRNRAVVVAPVHEHEHDAARRVVVECCWPAAEAVASWAAPPAQVDEEAAAVATKQIVLAESSPRNDDDVLMVDHHDRTGVAVAEPLEHPTVIAEDGDCGHRRIVADTDDTTAREQRTAGMEMEMEMELADDRTFEEFIESQKRKMRQESMQLLRLSYQCQAMATTCY